MKGERRNRSQISAMDSVIHRKTKEMRRKPFAHSLASIGGEGGDSADEMEFFFALRFITRVSKNILQSLFLDLAMDDGIHRFNLRVVRLSFHFTSPPFVARVQRSDVCPGKYLRSLKNRDVFAAAYRDVFTAVRKYFPGHTSWSVPVT